jgi:proline iminopeptidase
MHRLGVALVLASVLAGHPAAGQEGAKLFPAAEPFRTGYLDVSDLHRIFFACCGNPKGKPVMCLHGGPGVGCYPRLARYFDPEKFLIVLHDQRGAGRSRPHGELRENTTANLVSDVEKLRKHLGLGKVLVFGGSWGTTLGLAYAEAYPANVAGLVLRGVFLGTREEIEFHYQGTGLFFPREQAALLEVLPDRTRGTDPDYLYELVCGDDEVLRERVFEKLAHFEFKFMKLRMPDETIASWLESVPRDAALRTLRLDLHYVSNRYFLEKGQLLENLGKLKGIPVTLINGRYDMATPPRTAFLVHRALPGSKFVMVEAAGHSESEDAITAALLEAVAAFQ